MLGLWRNRLILETSDKQKTRKKNKRKKEEKDQAVHSLVFVRCILFLVWENNK